MVTGTVAHAQLNSWIARFTQRQCSQPGNVLHVLYEMHVCPGFHHLFWAGVEALQSLLRQVRQEAPVLVLRCAKRAQHAC